MRAVIIGAKGALGRSVTNVFKAHNVQVLGIDVSGADCPDFFKIDPLHADTDLKSLVEKVKTHFGNNRIDAVINVAGGWSGGGAKSYDLLSTGFGCFQHSVATSLLAASIAAHAIKPDGLIVLTGADAARGPTGGMLSYGAAKAAVHQLAASLATTEVEGGGTASVVAIAPGTLDTPANRSCMTPDDSWVATDDVAKVILSWATNPSTRPASGSVCSDLRPAQ